MLWIGFSRLARDRSLSYALMADTFHPLKSALSECYAFELQSGVGRLTTAKAAARQSVGKPTLRGVGRFSDSQLAEPRVYPW